MIPIYKPFMPDDILSELNEILYSDQLSYGKYGKQFEEELKTFIGCEYLLTVNSYNIAMLVILTTLGLEPGDEIIASPVSCLASNQPFVTKKLKVIWADIDPETGLLCPSDVESKITKKTKAIFHNHFCGFVGQINEVNLLGEKYGIPIIDDSIEAFGSEYKGFKIGNVGTDFTVFSFQTVRFPNTIDGGAIAFRNKAMYEKAKLVRDYGIDRRIFRDDNGEINSDCDIKLEGYGALMPEINSYIGIRQMIEAESIIKAQNQNAEKWKEKLFDQIDIQPLRLVPETKPNFWVYGMLASKKTQSIKKFKSEGYFATGVHINNNIYSIFNNKTKLPGVEEFTNKFVAIPSGWWVKI